MVEEENTQREESVKGDLRQESAEIYLKVPPGSRIQLTIENQTAAGPGSDGEIIIHYDGPGEITRRAGTWGGDGVGERGTGISSGLLATMRRGWTHAAALARRLPLATWLFLIALALYLATRAIGLEDFPIYFFTDEAVQTVRAADFVRDGYKNYAGESLPTFFINNSLYCLSLSVYNQVIPYLLFGKSVVATRGAAMLVTLLAAIWVGWTLRDVFQIEHWWLGTLVLSITPVWFLHSRTAFEYGLMVTFYSGFLYYYMRYRKGETGKLYPALVLGACSFYSYMPGQVIMVASGLLLLVFDARYHWQQRKTGLRGAGVLVLTALPMVRFLIQHPMEFANRLVRYQSYWVKAIPLSEKWWIYIREYLSGLNPLYWYFPHEQDLARHVMDGYGHMLWYLLPFMLLGLWLLVRCYWKSGEARTVAAAVLAAPAGAATVEMGVTRSLTMVIPLVLITSLGLAACIDWLGKKLPVKKWTLVLLVFVLLAAINSILLFDSLFRGPVWYGNYGLSGMQYGARQVFSEARLILAEKPETKIDISPTWMNGANEVARFFMGDPLPITMRSIRGYEAEWRELDKNHLLVMTPVEYKRAVESEKFTDIEVEKILPYPNGEPGFYFVRLLYVEDIDSVMEAERDERRVLREDSVVVKGGKIHVSYSTLDMGKIIHIFDGDPATLIRSAEANPLQVQMDFVETRPAQQIAVKVGGGPTWIQVDLFTESGDHLIYTQELTPVPEPRFAVFPLREELEIRALHFQVKNMDDGEPSHVHVWDVVLE